VISNLVKSTSYKALALALAVVLMTVGLSACMVYPIYLQVDLKNSKAFNVDNVSLKFCYGAYVSEAGSGLSSYPFWRTDLKDDDVIACYALYFCDGQNGNQFLDFLGPYDDYHNIEGQYLVKEISYEELSSAGYAVTKSLWGFRFKHQEVLAVPRGVFERENGSFCLLLVEVCYSPSINSYYLHRHAGVEIGYEYTNQKTVLLSAISSLSP